MTKIIVIPSLSLRKKSTPVEKVDKQTLKLIADLKKALTTCGDVEGVGISAPQIGVNKRVFLIAPNRIVINPEILEFSKKTNYDALAPEDRYFEGCLSVPEIYGEVRRSWSIKVRYQTINSQLETRNQATTLTGYDSIYFQHEFDHLEGILFTDRVLEQGGKLYRQTKNGEFEEVTP